MMDSFCRAGGETACWFLSGLTDGLWTTCDCDGVRQALTREDGSRLTFSGVNYSLLIVRKKKRKISATLTFRLVATNKTAAGNHSPFLPDFFFTAFKWKSALFCVNSLFFSSANTASKLRLLGFKKILRWKWKTDGKFTLWVHVQKKKRDEKSDMPKVKSGDLCPQKSAR